MKEAEKVNFKDLPDSEVSFGELPGGAVYANKYHHMTGVWKAMSSVEDLRLGQAVKMLESVYGAANIYLESDGVHVVTINSEKIRLPISPK